MRLRKISGFIPSGPADETPADLYCRSGSDDEAPADLYVSQKSDDEALQLQASVS